MTENFSSSHFLNQCFETYSFRKADSDFSLQSVVLNEEISICEDFDATFLQDSWSYRNVQMAKNLSFALIDEKGVLNLQKLYEAIQFLKFNTFSLGPNREHDDGRQLHLLKFLTLLYENSELQNALKRFQKPEANLLAEQVIRETLNLSSSDPISVADSRRAVLSALLTKLRQNVGSCFATAPAIIIHEHQPLNFLSDISQLFGKGHLTRTFGGVQYTVPLSPNWGVGDLLRPIFLHTLGERPLEILSLSPGLQKAFSSISLINEKSEPAEKRKALQSLLQKGDLLSKNSWLRPLTPEEIIRKTLLNHYGLKEEEVKSYLDRSVEGALGELALNIPAGKKTKSLVVFRYLKALETAFGAFKSLTDNALLKAWEFTLASFSEAKATAAKWNLYLSLGVSHEDAHGIGEAIYDHVQAKIKEINERFEEWQSQYDHLFAQAKYLEGRIRRAHESEEKWIRAEYEIRRREIDKLLDERDAAYEKGKKLSNLYSFLINFYGEKIPEFFQEIYDANMHDVKQSEYDDSPAGFRLLYKHGRANPSLWTLIHSQQEYIQFLTSFFITTEVELSSHPETEGLEREISSLVTAIITTIKRPEFLESSFLRLARAYNEPYIKNSVENLDRVKRKPWAYVSGGTMGTLVSCYFGSHKLPHETKRWTESETELLGFMIDSLKEMPSRIKTSIHKAPDLPLLAFSPTHAFLLKPGFDLFQKGWESDTYTYTWIRDEWVNPGLRFLDENILDVSAMRFFCEKILSFFPQGYREMAQKGLQNFFHPLSAPEFREMVLRNLSYEHFLKENGALQSIADQVDSLLFCHLPLFSTWKLRGHLERVYEEMGLLDKRLKETLFSQFEAAEKTISHRSILTSQDLKNFAKAFLILALKKTRVPFPFHKQLTNAMQKLKLAYPKPFLVADTNWVKNLFGFTVNPGTGKVEFWRFDDSGSIGHPVSLWKKYLNGSNKEDWGIYDSPQEYGIF